MTKEQVREHFVRYGIFYVAWILLAIFLSNWLVGLVVEPMSEEKISIFISTTDIDQASVATAAEELEMPSILEVETNVVPSSEYLWTYVSALLPEDTDIVLLSKTDADEILPSYGDLFLELDTVTELTTSETVFYTTEDGKNYGIQLTNFISSESEETYYLFLTNYSLHILGYNDSSIDSYAIRVAEQLLGVK